MSYDFFGREKELRIIHQFLNTDKFQGFLIYGRRRVGKSSLIKKSLEGYQGKIVYFQALNNVTSKVNLLQLNSLLQIVYPNALIVPETFSDFKEAFEFIFKESLKEDTVLVLDEYSYLKEQEKGLDSVLQILIDKYQKESHLKLFLCGSIMDTMLHIIDSGNPLFGRLSCQIRLQPFDYLDAGKMLSFCSDENKFKYYAILGGSPYLLSLVHKNLSFEENLKILFLSPLETLRNEVLFGVSQEVHKIPYGEMVLSIISRGVQKYSDIKKNFYQLVSNANLDYILLKLLDAGFIDKSFPINEEGNKKRLLYRLTDNCQSFYFKICYGKESLIDTLGVEAFYKVFVEKQLQDYLGHAFEKVSKEFLCRANQNLKLKKVFWKIGTYFYNDRSAKLNLEFDVVTLDEDGYTFYECKYLNGKVSNDVLTKEKKQVLSSPLSKARLGFISSHGFTEEALKNDYSFFTLHDFYHMVK